jgi:hypothetical protein
MRDEAKAPRDVKPRGPIFCGPFARLASRRPDGQDVEARVPVLTGDSLTVIAGQPYASAITSSSRRKHANYPRYRRAAFSTHFISCAQNGAWMYALPGSAGMESGPLGRGNGKRSGAHSVPCRGGVSAHMPIMTSTAVGAISSRPRGASFMSRKRHDAARRNLRRAAPWEVPRLALGKLTSARLVPAPAEDGQDPGREQR